MKNAWGATAAAVAAGLVMAAVPGAAHAAERTIVVPGDFVKALSDTRATGHYEVVGSGLRISTTGFTSTDKVAEYVAAADVELGGLSEPSLDYSNTSGGGVPGFQVVIDTNADGLSDGILIGEPVYQGEWWASNSASADVKAAAPAVGTGFGSPYHGTFDQWRANLPSARVLAFGFSLGSGVKGDGVIDAINFNGDRYTFSDKVPDTTPPVVTCDVAAPGPSFGYGTTGQVTASVTDADSGVSSPSVSAAADTGSLGTKTVTLTATDNAGNPASKDCPYTVVAGTAASVAVVSGSGQSAPVGTAFAQPVKVRVTDAGGNPVAAVPVTFTAPTTGASGSFMGGSVVTDETGTAAVTVTATGSTGTWTGSASVTGVSKAATFSLTNTAAPAKRADLRVTLTGPAQLSKGQAGSYVLTVTNVGPDAATEVLSSLALPCGVSITSTGGGARVGNLVVWPTVKSLASGSSATYTVTVKATAKGTWKAVGGAASLKTPDPVLTNNLAAASASVR